MRREIVYVEYDAATEKFRQQRGDDEEVGRRVDVNDSDRISPMQLEDDARSAQRKSYVLGEEAECAGPANVLDRQPCDATPSTFSAAGSSRTEGR